MSTGFDVNLSLRSRPKNLAIIDCGDVRLNLDLKGFAAFLRSEYGADNVTVGRQPFSQKLLVRTDNLQYHQIKDALQQITGITLAS